MNTNKIIGNPSDFAIEYSISIPSCPPFGKCRLWLQGMFLGDIEDENYLSTICCCLEGFFKNKDLFFLDDYLYNSSDEDIFDLMVEEKIDETGKYWFLYTSGFDAFLKYVYRKDDCFQIIWMLDPELKNQEEYQQYPSKTCSAKIDIAIYTEVVTRFRRDLEKICKF